MTTLMVFEATKGFMKTRTQKGQMKKQTIFIVYNFGPHSITIEPGQRTSFILLNNFYICLYLLD
ncbi:unnamed protein product [Cuscuta europaea]|uniref:Uncharacterized protein n=1 Tax=Cuscuta europaea TaxID=41803 RepID=A0A9P0ZWS4_CUSEU|nr:unnamed protein product [Cuscuta europaea]